MKSRTFIQSSFFSNNSWYRKVKKIHIIYLQARGNANIDEKLITLREKINNVTEFFHDDWNNAVIIVEETLAKMDKSYMNNFDKVLYDLSKHRIVSDHKTWFYFISKFYHFMFFFLYSSSNQHWVQINSSRGSARMLTKVSNHCDVR